MMCSQIYGVRLFILYVGLALSLSCSSIAAVVDTTTYGEPRSVSARFPFGDLTETEQREFSSLVYTVGSTRGNTTEIITYCIEKANYYNGLRRQGTAEKWQKTYKEKALHDIDALEKFYVAADANASSIASLITASPRSTTRKSSLELESEEPEYDLADYNRAVAKIKAQKLQADALFHHFYPLYDNGAGACWKSLRRKIARYTEAGAFCRSEPNFTVPNKENGEDFYNFYNTIVPSEMQVGRQVVKKKRILRSPTDEALKVE